MVFKAKSAHTYKLRVTLEDRRSAICSTGTTERRVANDVEAMVKRFKARRRWDVLEAIVLKQVTLAAVYDAEQAGTLDALMAELKDVDLDPLVTEWKADADPKYVRQVRRLIPEGRRFVVSRFRRRVISKFLAGLKCDSPTKNRYRAALSAFAKWLVENEVIETNVVRDVAMYKENDPRMVWMTWADAIRVADAAPQPYRTLYRLMAATGIELGAALKLQRPDVDLKEKTIAVRGTKTAWRSRVVRFEQWATFNLTELCNPLIGFAPLFPGIKHKDALATFKAAQQAVGLSGHRLHDLRHTYAVNALKQGYKPTVIAFQLGHKDASMVTKVYGRFVPDASDYAVTKQRKAK
jgi:integrase